MSHPLAQAVAKAVCLLQFVKTIRPTPENIAAALADQVDGDSKLPQVHEALAELEKGQFVRHGEEGWRIPTPSEDDWDKQRQGLDPRSDDERKLFADELVEFWKPQPSFTLGDSKVFKAGLMIDGTEKVILDRIEERTRYGEQATGKYLEDDFGKPNFGWSFDAVRLLTLSLVRAGAITVTHKGQTLDSARSQGCEEAFTNNPSFRLASFRPRKGVDFLVVAQAADQFRQTFGDDIPELNEQVVAEHIKTRVEQEEQGVVDALQLVRTARMPGDEPLASALDAMQNIRRGGVENAILGFGAAHKAIGEAIKRSAELKAVLDNGGMERIGGARKALAQLKALEAEPDFDPNLAEEGAVLENILSRETFFRDLPRLDQAAKMIAEAHAKVRGEALRSRAAAYSAALQRLAETLGWETLDAPVQAEIAAPLKKYAEETGDDTIAQLRSDRDACGPRLDAAVRRVLETVDGERLETISVEKFFGAGIESEEQLEQALAGLRDELSRLIGEGKKVIVR